MVKIHYDLSTFGARNPVVTTGTFDGVHLGHRTVIDKLKQLAAKFKGESVVFTFHPHPRLVTSPDETNLRLLTTIEEKTELFREIGIDHLIVYPFTKAFSQLTYAEFVKQILVNQIRTRCLVVGYDHKFGKNREGGYEYLQKCAREYGFDIEKLDALLLEENRISSTKIRDSLQEGNIRKANLYLGYSFTLHGVVVEGKQVGRKIGFPTANVETSDPNKIIPGYGVYVVKTLVDGHAYFGMLNIGTRPTFNHNADHRSVEVHLFDFQGNIYNKAITVIFIDKIREEQKFSSADALTEQLKKDRLTALQIIRSEANA